MPEAVATLGGRGSQASISPVQIGGVEAMFESEVAEMARRVGLHEATHPDMMWIATNLVLTAPEGWCVPQYQPTLDLNTSHPDLGCTCLKG
eukprot:6435989-Pyramimonas_sp.AAC.1